MERPTVKSVFPPIPHGQGVLRVGSYDYGLAAEITDDEAGHVLRLMQLMDGSRTEAELVAAMQAVDPAVGAAEVAEAIEALTEAGYVEDAAVAPPAVFSPSEVERYRRNFDFFNYFNQPTLTKFDFQARLKQAKVTVLGVGGLGSYVALSLAAIGVGTIRLVDDDVVEPSNLNRQVLYMEQDLGHPKVEAAAKRLAEINPHVKVEVWHKRIRSVEDARGAMRGMDLLICAADRPRILIYEWVNRAALLEGIAWIRGANDGLTVNSFLHVPGETACFDCIQTESVEANPGYATALAWVMREIGDRTVNPCISPVAGLIGNLTAFEAVKFLTGISRPTIWGRKLTFDLQSLETRFSPESERHANCPACGARVREGAGV